MAKTISEYYEQDHDRLDKLFRNFQELKRSDFPKAKENFREFKFGLQRHIVWEEEILFPLFERKTGVTHCGPTEVMRIEHRKIGKHLEAIHDKVKVADPDSDLDEALLLEVLTEHNMKEEEILYPGLDGMVTESEVREVFSQMESIPKERYEICCGDHPVKG